MADDIASNVVGTMLEPIRDSLYAFISRQFGYAVHCKRYTKDFQEEVDKLRHAKGRVDTKVKEALDNAEIIEDDVSEWLAKVQSSLPTMEEDGNRLLQGTENLKCLDVCSRYRLGKEGKKKKAVVTKLIEDGSNFGPSVGHRPPLTHTWHRTHTINYESFESRELVFNNIMEALKDDANYKIGIHGMPGVGKTRMMQEVAQQAKNKRLFDEIAKIVVSQNPNLKDIQLKLAARLNMKLDMETKDEDERRELLRVRLKNGKKILVLVDDVWNDQIKLEDIGIPAADDHTKGCKIILTSRRQDVCKEMGVPEKDDFQIGVLSEAEAWSLFEKKVGYSFQTHEMHSVTEAVCRECAGLPLAILAVGGALKNKSNQVWKDALKQLKNSMVNNVGEIQTKLYSRIEWSYNYLEHVDAKKIFLLCCLFKEDAEISIDDLVLCGVGLRLLLGVDTMEDARNRAHAVVDTLKTSSLLLEGNKKHLVKMHDIIRDVAISIASKNKDAMYLVKAGVEKWPKEEEYKGRRAISLRLNKDCVLPDNSDCPELRTLMLEGSYPPSEVPNSFFDGMVKLEVLHLRNMQILTLPSSLKNLRMLRLYDYRLENVTFMGELKKLEILVIENYWLKELAPEIRQLTLLRLLDLRCCSHLNILPSGVISSLSQLEELYIPHEFDQWEVQDNASLNELNSLTRLISLQVHVPNVESLNELLIKSLIRFKISIGHKFYHYEIRPSSTKILKLVSFPLKKRELNILMQKAEVLYLIQLNGLKDVFHDTHGEGFQELESLQVEDCDVMEHLLGKPKWINSQSNQLCDFGGSFSKLSELEVINCPLMKYLFSAATARGLPQLQRLRIDKCEMLEEIVGDIEQEAVMDTITFHQLKRMELKCLPNLRSFYGNTTKMSTRGCNTSTLAQALFDDKVRFPALEELEIYDLKSLTTIWDNELFLSSKGEDSFGRLRIINVQKCHKPVNVFPPNALPLLQGLEILEVEECDSVVCGVEMVGPEEGGDEILVFSRLKTMRLIFLPNFKSFCWSRSRGEDRVLKGKNILLQKQTLFNHKVAFPALETLEIDGLGSLIAIWDDPLQLLLVKEAEDSFRQLMYMKVFKCEKLVNVIPSNMLLRLQNLKKLEVSECDSVVYEVEVIGTVEKGYPTTAPIINVLPRLQEMKLYDLPNLVMYIRLNRLCAYSNLTDLHLSNRDSLGNVFSPSTARYLMHLQKLTVENCEKMEEIVAIERGQLGEEDVVHDDDIIVFSQLKHLQLWTLPNLKSFCSCTRGSKKQEEETMEQKNISTVEALFNHKVRFPVLEELKIGGLKSLTAIWDNQSFLGSGAQDSFRQLRLVNVKDCEKLVRVLEESNIPPPQTLFNHKVKFPSSLTMNVFRCPKLEMFPCIGLNTLELKTFDAPLQPFQREKVELPILEKLVLGGGKIVEGTWHGHPSTGAFCKVRLLEVKNCRKLVNASNLLQWYEVVEELTLKFCFSLEVVFKLEELDAIERKAIVSSQIKNLTLICLPKLVHIWIMDPQGLSVFHKLTSLTVNNCHSLRYLLSFSIASLLTQLRVLVVERCSVIEEIVRSEQGEEDAKGDIVFSQLVSLKLWDLPKFTSFCWANRAFKFPALEEVILVGCPQLQTFTSGDISTPLDIKVTGDYGLLRHVSDLNNYVQRYIRKGKGLARADRLMMEKQVTDR